MYYEVFKKLCEERGMRPSEVSRGTGIATATLTSWKKGVYTPKGDKLKKIADFFNVPVSVFYDDQTDTSSYQKEYYDPETLEFAQAIYDNPDLRALMKAAMHVPKESQVTLTQLLHSLKETNPNE